MVSLRPYQVDLVESIRDEYRQGRKRVLAVAPTGAGKTICFSYIAQQSLNRGTRTLILVHRQELLDQTSRTLAAFDVPHGLVAARVKPDFSHGIQLASVQSLIRRMEKMPAPDLIVIDEAHHAVAGSWRKVIDRYTQSRLLGVTATPERLDGQGLGSVFEQIVYGPSVLELQEAGHLSRAKYFAPTTADLAGVKTKLGDFDLAELDSVMNQSKIIGDAVENYAIYAGGMSAIAFCVSRDHARNVAEAFCRAGYDAATLDGSLNARERRSRVEALGNGELKIVTSCEIINEGFDVPIVGGAILLRPTQSLGLHLQQIGRVLRPAPGKDHAIIIDHVGNLRRHGLAHSVRDWTLDDRAKRQFNKGESVDVKQCPECYCCHEPNLQACPECGFEYEKKCRKIEEVDGDLVELDETTLPRRQQIALARTFEDLQRLGQSWGYRSGWAHIVWKKRKNKKHEQKNRLLGFANW